MEQGPDAGVGSESMEVPVSAPAIPAAPALATADDEAPVEPEQLSLGRRLRQPRTIVSITVPLVIIAIFFWLNGDGAFPIPTDAYYMAGAGGQNTIIIQSHDLVVVRLGHSKGQAAGRQGLDRALTLLLEAVPPRE